MQASGPMMPSRRLPAGGAMRAIGVQRMESPAAAPKPTRFRPAPGYTPKPSTDPVVAKPKRRRGGNRKQVKERKFLPFESVPEMRKRVAGEAAYNKSFAAKNNPPPTKRTPVASGGGSSRVPVASGGGLRTPVASGGGSRTPVASGIETPKPPSLASNAQSRIKSQQLKLKI